jgi:hypothetical protein
VQALERGECSRTHKEVVQSSAHGCNTRSIRTSARLLLTPRTQSIPHIDVRGVRINACGMVSDSAVEGAPDTMAMGRTRRTTMSKDGQIWRSMSSNICIPTA